MQSLSRAFEHPTFEHVNPLLPVLLALLLTLIVTRRILRPGPRIPWKLGRLTVDLRGGSHTIHAVVAGMSGTGKSTAVVPLLQAVPRALVVAFDNSRPIRDLFESQGWTIWQPGGDIGWDILSGSAQVVSEALTAGFARSDADTGYNRGLAQMRLWHALDDLDEAQQPRTLDALVSALKRNGANPDDTRACRTWANRFERIAMSLGPSLGADMDLSECMRNNEKVLILPNRFLSPEDAPIIGGIALVQARRVAQEVGNFLLVVEEAGQAGSRQVEMNALAQAGRDRGCPLVVLTQNMAKLPEEVVNNVKVWVSFAQESKREVAFAAEHLRIEPADVQLENMPTGYAWVRSPEHRPTRTKLRLPKYQRRELVLPDPTEYGVPAEGSYKRRRTIVREIRSEVVVPALPMPEKRVQELLDRIDRTQGECWLWKGTKNKDGYGVVYWGYGDGRPANNRPAHQVVWEVINGRPFPVDETGRIMDWDHRRTCPRHCVYPGHGEPMTRAQNVKNMHRTRGHAMAD